MIFNIAPTKTDKVTCYSTIILMRRILENNVRRITETSNIHPRLIIQIWNNFFPEGNGCLCVLFRSWSNFTFIDNSCQWSL